MKIKGTVIVVAVFALLISACSVSERPEPEVEAISDQATEEPTEELIEDDAVVVEDDPESMIVEDDVNQEETDNVVVEDDSAPQELPVEVGEVDLDEIGPAHTPHDQVTDEEAQEVIDELDLEGILQDDSIRGENFEVVEVTSFPTGQPALMVHIGTADPIDDWGQYYANQAAFYDAMRDAGYEPCGDLRDSIFITALKSEDFSERLAEEQELPSDEDIVPEC